MLGGPAEGRRRLPPSRPPSLSREPQALHPAWGGVWSGGGLRHFKAGPAPDPCASHGLFWKMRLYAASPLGPAWAGAPSRPSISCPFSGSPTHAPQAPAVSGRSPPLQRGAAENRLLPHMCVWGGGAGCLAWAPSASIRPSIRASVHSLTLPEPRLHLPYAGCTDLWRCRDRRAPSPPEDVEAAWPEHVGEGGRAGFTLARAKPEQGSARALSQGMGFFWGGWGSACL